MALNASAAEWRCTGAPANVGTMRERVADFAAGHGAEGKLLGDIRLVVSESVTNAIVHGLRDGRDGSVVVRAAVTDTEFTIRVSDDGVGMSPHPERDGMGVGLAIIRAVTSAMQIEPVPGGGTSLAVAFPWP